MPTNYTAAIRNGIDFYTYAMDCARAFGACMTLREAPPGGACIPETFTPSDYCLKALDKAREELSALESKTPAELEQAAAKAWDTAETHRLMHLNETLQILESYEKMLEKVLSWEPPTPDHTAFNNFMKEQIEKSIKVDCFVSEYRTTQTVRLNGQEWLESQRKRILDNIQFCEREYAKDVERARKQTEWIQALRGSLP